MVDRSKDAVQHWRGLDPGWGECGGISYNNLLVRAPCEAVVRAFREHPEVPKRVENLLTDDDVMIGPVRDEPYYVYQLSGHEWSQVESWDVLTTEMAQDLSRRLDTRSFVRMWEDIASALAYQLYERGDLVEDYGMLHDNPIYQGPEGEADHRRKLSEGWQISRDHTFEFFSRRGTKLDIESPQECYALPGRVVLGLGMFVACQPFWLNLRFGRVERMEGWNREHFAAAYVLSS